MLLVYCQLFQNNNTAYKFHWTDDTQALYTLNNGLIRRRLCEYRCGNNSSSCTIKYGDETRKHEDTFALNTVTEVEASLGWAFLDASTTGMGTTLGGWCEVMSATHIDLFGTRFINRRHVFITELKRKPK